MWIRGNDCPVGLSHAYHQDDTRATTVCPRWPFSPSRVSYPPSTATLLSTAKHPHARLEHLSARDRHRDVDFPRPLAHLRPRRKARRQKTCPVDDLEGQGLARAAGTLPR